MAKKTKSEKSNLKLERQFQEDLKNKLEDLITTKTSNNIDELNVNSNAKELVKISEEQKSLDKGETRVQLDKLKEASQNKAIELLDKCLSFYLDLDIIDENDYIIAKLNIDKMSISSLLRQLEINNRIVDNIVTSLENGMEFSPRMYEVLATLQQTNLDINKQITATVLIIQDSLKSHKQDMEIYNRKNIKNIKIKEKEMDIEDVKLYKGQRDLIMSLTNEDISNE